MASEAQIRANQENAQKSKGPTSIEGKKKSSMNAVTHGIFSNIAPFHLTIDKSFFRPHVVPPASTS